MDDSELLRYSRHILLDEIGIEGQERLLGATALILGAGGLGSPAALYLAAAGVGHLMIADGDTVDATNLQRQILHTDASVGESKTDSARTALQRINPGVRVTTLPRLEGDALNAAVQAADVVLDCSDNFQTRLAVNRACVLHRTPLVSGAAIRFDGQFMVFDARQPNTPCYECLFPAQASDAPLACSVMGVFAPLTGVVGTLQAAEALKLLGGFGTPATGQLTLVEALGGRITTLRVPADPACPCCGGTPPH